MHADIGLASSAPAVMGTQDHGCATRSGRLSHPLNSDVERPLVDVAFRTGEVSYRCNPDLHAEHPRRSHVEHGHRKWSLESS